MRVLLLSTYELGHQPLNLASPAGALTAAGHEVRCLDLSLDGWRPDDVDWAEAAAFSVPMHTAMRLAVAAARELRDRRPALPVCFYGLYATVSRELTRAVADHAIAGEYEPGIVAWVDGLRGVREPSDGTVVDVRTSARTTLPVRGGLAGLDQYVHLTVGDDHRAAGYVEASRGCAHRCRHCPIPVVYDGRTRVVSVDDVVADVTALVAAGARHVTFGDPDFLNAPAHALRVAAAVHDRFPDLTFDCTVKVEHILRHRRVWPQLAAAGCLFAVTAVETVDDAVLARLDKGHTAAEAGEAVAVLRAHGIEPRPSFVPFTPWTTLDGLVDLLDWVAAHDLVGNVEPIQYTIRLLVPDGSLLLDDLDLRARLDHYDAERLTWTWRSEDPAVDDLQQRLAALVEADTAADRPAGATYLAVARAVRDAAGRAGEPLVPAGSIEGRPRLTEPWFC